MAFGTHWEWRAFGTPPLRALVAALGSERRLDPDDAGDGRTDDYLWVPGMRGNVKLREGSLKFKRFVEARGGFELWTELEEDVFDFPLTDAAARLVQAELPGTPPGSVAEWGTDVDRFKDALSHFRPAVRIVSVRKERITFGQAAPDDSFTVELAEILAPEPTFSIAVEGPPLAHSRDHAAGLEKMHEIVHDLGLPGSMRVCGYLPMLARWA